jgi:hypothetical protein
MTPNDTSKTANMKIFCRNSLYQVVRARETVPSLYWKMKREALMFNIGKAEWVRSKNRPTSVITFTCTDDYRLAQLFFATGDSMSDIYRQPGKGHVGSTTFIFAFFDVSFGILNTKFKLVSFSYINICCFSKVMVKHYICSNCSFPLPCLFIIVSLTSTTHLQF